ncbi:MAG TPA: hypothetical protein VL866_10535 [Pyrinomonadaceae bacterium]|nr:hypothetical protein [Pyrinomonadaceae bacterium]
MIAVSVTTSVIDRAICGGGMKTLTWIKRLGLWGFLFFLVKGLLWLLVPALIAIWSTT